MKLLIVESPAKAKTISKYLHGEYTVRASIGHIRDLPKSNKKAIDVAAGFIPHYEIVKGKERVVDELSSLSKEADEIVLATDPDREGEAIAWHVAQALGLENSKPAPQVPNPGSRKTPNPKPKVERVVFNEITQRAVQEAMTHPRSIDMKLVSAQQARRVLDRLFGYDLSGLIWKKVRYGLSAGRVQSPALRIIVEREREIRAFVPEDYWVISGQFQTPRKEILVLMCAEEPKTEKEALRIVSAAKEGSWHIISVTETETKRSPRPPFITSTLQQTASSRFGFSPSYTMSIAQKLYEQGHISYMRTDSPILSQDALPAIYAEIEKAYGANFLLPRTYTAKSKTAQEAHEAIRPSNIKAKTAGSTPEQKKLYALIRERTLASQMADAKILRTKISANIAESKESIPDFSINGSIMAFPGWLQADQTAKGEELELPKLKEGDPLILQDIASEAKKTEPPARYTEAGLVKELERREIGRPSTYATILKTLQDRGYVEKLGRALKPTDTGEVVSTFLEENFSSYISDSFTAEMENDLDEIADGKREYAKTLRDFYGPFTKEVKSKEKIAKLTNLGEAPKEFPCPVCGSPMIIKLSRTGKFLSCSRFPKCHGARKIDGTVLEAPKETGEMCPECTEGKLIEREGRFGKFISCSNYPKCKYIKKSAEEEARAKTGVQCPKCKDGEIVERRGRFGPFFSCSNYPKCDFAIKARPTGTVCPLCSSLMMEGTKTIPERCSSKNCPNHNPHLAQKT
ncbi:MAG: type I DNA topoisomerase [Candidatus Sungbacteria bacterium]|nr:type I DNA topoisomerase [Candidatus Sungbacteria bacterium]